MRIFRTPTPGVLQVDDAIAVTEAIYNGVVLRHCSFAERWFKINVTTDLAGIPIETDSADAPFAFNCDIATPMERDGDSIFGVDLFIDVPVRADASSYFVGDEKEFEEMLHCGLLSAAEARSARQAVLDFWPSLSGDTYFRGFTSRLRSGRVILRKRRAWIEVPCRNVLNP